MALPKITIVTPSFRAENTIEETITSVISQGYPDLEYIVLDGAGDATADILHRYDDRLHFWRSAPDEGQYAAITEGFGMASGEVLGWINSDDILLPRSLFVIGEIFAQFPEVEWISTLQPANLDANGSLAYVGRLPGFNRQAFLDGVYLPGVAPKGFWIQQESTFFRRSLWERAGGRIPPYKLAGDFALWCEFSKHAELCGVEYPLGAFRMVEGQRSEDMDTYLREGREALGHLREALGHAPAAAPQPTDVYAGLAVFNADRKRRNAGWRLMRLDFAPQTEHRLW